MIALVWCKWINTESSKVMLYHTSANFHLKWKCGDWSLPIWIYRYRFGFSVWDHWVNHVTAVYCNDKAWTMIVTMIDKLGSLPAGVSQCMRQIGTNTHTVRQNVMARLKGFYVEIKPQWYMDILDSDFLQLFQYFKNMLWNMLCVPESWFQNTLMFSLMLAWIVKQTV